MVKNRKSISNNVYETIREHLLSQELNFGDKIVELDYCEKLNVSRTPLREAIKQLEIEGIIERAANGRIKIMSMDEKRIDEIFQIRIALEDIIFNNLNSNKDFISKLENNLKLTEFQIKSENWNEARKLFSEFNKILYSYSNLEFTIKSLKFYNFILEKLRYNSLENSIRIIEAYQEHLKLLTYFKNNDIENAKLFNKQHLLHSKESILAFFREKDKISNIKNITD